MQFAKLLTQYRQQSSWVNPIEIKNTKLRNILNDLYRKNAKIGSGSTADAVRFELANPGSKVGGSEHLSKVKEQYIPGLKSILLNSSISAHERRIAEDVLFDLLDSIGEKLWYSQTLTPKL